jgi:hypothetical protein
VVLLARLLRGHWAIETLHWIRDVSFDEDSSQVRTSNGPQIMAALRNLVITALRLARHANIAAALRHHAPDAHRPVVEAVASSSGSSPTSRPGGSCTPTTGARSTRSPQRSRPSASISVYSPG